MGLVFFSPFGIASEESGLLALLANYCESLRIESHWLACNGVFSLCDRDAESAIDGAAFKRPLTQCISCVGEQRALAKWSKLQSHDLSGYIQPDDIETTKRWCEKLSREELFDAGFEGIPLHALCAHSIHQRFGTDRPDLAHRAQEQTVRRIYTSAARALLGFERFIASRRIDVVFLAGGRDFITASLLEQGRLSKVARAVLNWDLNSRAVSIKSSNSNHSYSCPLVFEDVTSMRPDPRTWPRELLKILDEILVYCGISEQQLSLPLAQ